MAINNIEEARSLDVSGELSVKDLILKIQKWWRFILSKWVIILTISLIGSAIGLIYSLSNKTVYKASLNFALQDEKSGSTLSGALGLASQFGVDLGGGAGGEFSGDNLLELMRSRSMIEKALLTTVVINGKQQTLAQLYINFNNLRHKWENTPQLKNIDFLPNADPSHFTLSQDSIISVFHKDLIKKNLTVDKADKKLSIISVSVSSENEMFSKYFTEVLTTVVSNFYIETKTEKAAKNVAVLKGQTDSVRTALNKAIMGVASSIDAAPSPNPIVQSIRVPSQRRQVDVQANTVILGEMVKNLEISRMSLLQETPLIHIIDRPVLPLDKERFGKLKGIVLGGMLFMVLAVFVLTFNKIYKEIIHA